MPPPSDPRPVTQEELLNRSLASLPAGALDSARRLVGAVGSIGSLRSTLAGTAEFAASLGRVLRSAGQPSPLLVGRSLRRRCAAFEVGLDDLRRSGRAVGASLNVVYLGCIAAALRRYHDELGQPIENLPMAIPVDLHRSGDAATESHFGAILIAAPLAMKDASKRLKLIARAVRAGRAETAIDAMGMMAPILARLPASMLRTLAGSAPRPDILASGLRGPSQPRYLAGREDPEVLYLRPGARRRGDVHHAFDRRRAASSPSTTTLPRSPDRTCLRSAWRRALRKRCGSAAGGRGSARSRRADARPGDGGLSPPSASAAGDHSRRRQSSRVSAQRSWSCQRPRILR